MQIHLSKMISELILWNLFELVMALEDEYNIEIPAEELTELTTVGAVMDYLKSKGVEA